MAHDIVLACLRLTSACGSCRVAWSAAADRVSAELLCPYPPGIPAAVPGEVLTEAVLSAMKRVIENGGVVTGAADSELRSVSVVCEHLTIL